MNIYEDEDEAADTSVLGFLKRNKPLVWTAVGVRAGICGYEPHLRANGPVCGQRKNWQRRAIPKDPLILATL